MPRISAPTVAEHRARQRAALLEAARGLLVERGPSGLTLADVAHGAGLARSSIYEYFASKDDLLAGLCAEEFPRWAEQVGEAMARARTPRGRVSAYIRTQLELVAAGEYRLAVVLAGIDLDTTARIRIRTLHTNVLPPLVEALRALGDRDPELSALLLQGLVDAACERIEAGDPPKRVIRRVLNVALDGVVAPSSRSR